MLPAGAPPGPRPASAPRELWAQMLAVARAGVAAAGDHHDSTDCGGGGAAAAVGASSRSEDEAARIERADALLRQLRASCRAASAPSSSRLVLPSAGAAAAGRPREGRPEAPKIDADRRLSAAGAAAAARPPSVAKDRPLPGRSQGDLDLERRREVGEPVHSFSMATLPFLPAPTSAPPRCGPGGRAGRERNVPPRRAWGRPRCPRRWTKRPARPARRRRAP